MPPKETKKEAAERKLLERKARISQNNFQDFDKVKSDVGNISIDIKSLPQSFQDAANGKDKLRGPDIECAVDFDNNSSATNSGEILVDSERPFDSTNPVEQIQIGSNRFTKSVQIGSNRFNDKTEIGSEKPVEGAIEAHSEGAFQTEFSPASTEDEIGSNGFNDKQRTYANEIGANRFNNIETIDGNDILESSYKPTPATEIDSNRFSYSSVADSVDDESNAPEPPPVTKSVQIGSNGFSENQEIGSNRLNESVQIGSDLAKRIQDLEYTLAQALAKQVQIGSQIGSNRFNSPPTEPPETEPKNEREKKKIGRIEGIQKKLFMKLFVDCFQRGTRLCTPFNITSMSQDLECSLDTVKSILRRANDSAILLKVPGRRGRGGFSQYEMTPELFEAMHLISVQIGSEMCSSRAVVVGLLGKAEKPKSETVAVGATWEPGSPSNEDQAPARQPTPPTASAREGAETYKWAHKVEIPLNVRKIGIGIEQMEELEEYPHRKLTLVRVQQSVNQFSKALDKGMNKKEVNGKGDWNSIPAVFMEAMKKKGYFKINGDDDPLVIEAEKGIEK